MSLDIIALTALSLGTFHTVVGVDHYLPFIVLGKSSGWPLKKTLVITLGCGIGHVLSSVLIGLAGLLLGIALESLVDLEGVRGEFASWSLITFGIIYGTWGLHRGIKNKPHVHVHPHQQDHDHGVDHEHARGADHVHVHHHPTFPESRPRKELTVWSLFIIFVLGPCEPLIPLVMYEAIAFDWIGIAWVTFLFGIATVAVMLAVVSLASRGLVRLRVKTLERHVHAIAGFLIAGSGLAIMLFGI